MFERLPEIMKAYNIQVTDHQLSQLTLFYEMMIEKNKVPVDPNFRIGFSVENRQIIKIY